jgi:hypothetical protein
MTVDYYRLAFVRIDAPRVTVDGLASLPWMPEVMRSIVTMEMRIGR